MSSTEAPRPAPNERRGSLSLSEYFSSNRVPQSSYPGPITTAAAQASQRRASVSGNSPPQFSSSFGLRRGSVSSVSSTSSAVDENAVDDVDAPNVSPTSPLARRMSWGARAFRDVRIPAAMSTPRGPQSASASSPTVTRGFWENGPRGGPNDPTLQRRRQSISTMPAPPMADLPPPKEAAPMPQRDHHQERILKGELYMD